MARTLIPNDFRDFISISAFVSFLLVSVIYLFDYVGIKVYLIPLMFLVAGIGQLVVGKVFTVGKWAKDGIKGNEYTQIFSIMFGLSSVIIGIILFLNLGIPTAYRGLVGFLALFPAIYVAWDYMAKNKK